MDFKVAGTAQGVTSLQMDIKISGITRQIMHEALTQARQGRLHVLNVMNKHLDKPRLELSPYAPRIMTMQINPDKIRDVIGKGGATIREITEDTGATIDITDEGLVKIWASDGQAGEKAKERIKDLTAEAKVGEIYQGKISKVLDFGAFVNILPGQDGLLHISQIAEERIENIHDRLQQGQIVNVKVIEIDRQGRIKLSMKSMEAEA
jgi:polyribonucleotide nucleotidyltransferase